MSAQPTVARLEVVPVAGILGGGCGFERKICGEVCAEIWEHTTWYNSFAYDRDPLCESGIQ